MTRGEPVAWRIEDVRSAELRLTVEDASRAGLRLRLDGAALLATDADPDRAERGFAARLLGYLHFDARAGRIDRFDLVAVGDHWGSGPYTSGARPGRTPLGIAFELTRDDSAADRLPPQGARSLDAYFAAESIRDAAP